MKNLIWIILFTSLIYSCKKEQEEIPIDICEANYNPLSINIYSYGAVKHPFSEGLQFTNSTLTIAPNETNGLNSSSFTNVEVSIDGNTPLIPEEGSSSIQIQNLSAGSHTITMNLSCSKTILGNNSTTTCDCINEETHATREVEFIEPTLIRIDSLVFSQFLPCDGNNGTLCPDVYFDWSYYDIPNYTTFNYYSTEDSPLQLAYGDTISIYPQECIIPIKIYDADQFNDSDFLGEAEMNPTNMNNWTTGAHEIDSNFWIVITRLN